MNKKIQLLISISTILLSFGSIKIPAKADTYIETKVNNDFINSDYQGTLTQTRLGYEKQDGDNDFYVEFGPGYLSSPTAQTPTLGFEIGVTFPIQEHITGHFKYEGIYQTNQGQVNSDFETSVRYTF